jgi:hypothetical protein
MGRTIGPRPNPAGVNAITTGRAGERPGTRDARRSAWRGRGHGGFRAVVTLVASCALGPLSCVTVPRSPLAPLEASSAPYEPDLPIPEGFALRERSSEDWSSGTLRYLRHDYIGRAPLYAVRKFYREHMPRARWTPVSDSGVSGRYTLRFTRGRESCVVTVERVGAARVSVRVVIAPLAEAQSPAVPPRHHGSRDEAT